MQNPYAPPAPPPPGAPFPGPNAPYGYNAPQPGGPIIQGDTVTISRQLWWPPCCVKCGTMDGIGSRQQNYAWVQPWTYFLLFIGLVPALIIQLAMTKRATMTHPICARCNGRWSQAMLLWRLSILLPVFGGFGGFIIGAAIDSNVLMILGGLLFFPGIAIFPITAHFARVRPWTLRAIFIDPQVIKLAGVSAPALEQLRNLR